MTEDDKQNIQTDTTPPPRAAEPAGEADDSASLPDTLPVLPLRGAVAFPGTVTPLAIGRMSSRRMLDESLPSSKLIALVTQRDEEEEDPGPDELYEIGVAANVLKLVRQPDDSVSIITHGVRRIRVTELMQRKPFVRAAVEPVQEKPGEGRSFNASVKQLRQQARELIEITPNASEQATTVLMNIEDPSALADFLAANLQLDVAQKQDLLEQFDVSKRIRSVLQHVSNQLEVARLQQKIQADVQSTISDNQRKFYLREQLKAIRRELGEGEDDGDRAVADLRDRLEEADLPEAVAREASRDLDRLSSVPAASPEYSLLLNYLELVADLPWNVASEDNLDLHRAREILDRDHFDLDKVKRRLIEYLAVRRLNPAGRGPILCLVGPPGVGKTSLGQSVADALGRKFSRLSLGGIRDEAEIRGHRRTYVGAMPGRLIQEIRRAETCNPVIMLDEVDKLGADFRGDPASALLEVLDPRQNHAFVDRYLDVPFDLSSILFIATANYMGSVPAPLRDRMEVIEIPGYADNDKLEIARKYLVPRQLEENGLAKSKVRFQKAALGKIVNDYTREAGVRELERQIGSVCRGIAAEVAGGDGILQRKREQRDRGRTASASKKAARGNGDGAGKGRPGTWKVDPELVRDLLGPERFFRDVDLTSRVPGVSLGLAYTPSGGDVLFIEATAFPGKGVVTLTGQLGDVMRESVNAALSLFKARSERYGYDAARLAELDLHVHVPAGAVPKDGPSAGTAMYTALASLLLNKPARPRVAMTGEITLRGLVLPIGGVKEKSLAAARAGVKTVLLPQHNQADLDEVGEDVKKRVKFIFIDEVDALLEHALGVKPRADGGP